jgi:pyrimidine deaminase RibD-like protein
MRAEQFEITNYQKLDTVLYRLCRMVVKGQKKDQDYYGLVAAAVIDPNNNIVFGINLPASQGKRKHAERVAVDNYKKRYGFIPEGSIIVTTLSPCSEHMDERYGESCTDLLNDEGVKKVYAGFMDPTHSEEQREFNIIETQNRSIRDLCKSFANQFLDLDEN